MIGAELSTAMRSAGAERSIMTIVARDPVADPRRQCPRWQQRPLLRLDASLLDQGRPIGQLSPDIGFKLRPAAPESLDARCLEAILNLRIHQSFVNRKPQRSHDIIRQVRWPGQSAP